MTPLTKSVTRKSSTTIRDAGQRRELVITLYPNGLIGLRPLKTRREERITIEAVYSLAVKQRIALERAAKRTRKRGTP